MTAILHRSVPLPHPLGQMKADRQRLAGWLVTLLCLLSGAVLLLDILLEEPGAGVGDGQVELLEEVTHYSLSDN